MVDGCNETLTDALSWATSISRTRLTTVDSLGLTASSPSTAISDLQGILRTVEALSLKKIPYDELQENDYVGQGETFSVVRHKYGEHIVAVKFIKRDIVSGAIAQSQLRRRLQAVLREIQILQHGPIKIHPNIIHLMGYGWRLDDGRPYPYVVAEYGPLGSMRPFLRENPEIPLRHRLMLAGDIAAGLTALHDVEVIHGDLKLDNVVVFPTWDRPSGCMAKLCDFGHSIFLLTEDRQLYYYGTPLYLPPEALRQNVDPIPHEDLHKCDIWAFGLALWEVLTCGELYFQREWLTSRDHSLPTTPTLEPSSSQPQQGERSEAESNGPEAAAHALPDYTKYFGTFDLSKLQDLSQEAVQRACPVRNFQRSYLGPLLKWTLHPEPRKRPSRLSKFPIMGEAPSNSLKAKLAIHTRSTDFGYDMFRPERQEDIYWEHQVEIFKDFLSVANAERPGPKLGSVCFQLMTCYVLGFGCKIDYSLAYQNLRRAVENGMEIARIFQDEIAAALTGQTSADTTTTFASKLRSALSSQRAIDKTATLYLMHLHNGSQVPPDSKKYSLDASADAPSSRLLASAVCITKTSQEATLTQTCLSVGDLQPLSWLEYAILTDDSVLFQICCRAMPTSALSAVGVFNEEPIVLSYARPIVNWLFCLADDAVSCLQLALHHNPSLSTSMDYLCHKGFTIDPQWPTELSGTPLAFAVTTGSRDLVNELLRIGANPVAPALPLRDDGTESEWTAVHLAVKYNHVEILKDIIYHLEKGRGQHLGSLKLPLASALSFLTPIERFGIHGSAATHRLHDTLSILPPASLFWQSSEGATPLLHAIDFGSSETVKALLAKNPRLAEAVIANPNDAASRMLPLHFAAQICARRGCSDAQTIPRVILEAFPNALSTPDEGGLTPLHFAAAGNFAEVTRLLISEGSQVNALDELGRSPLMLCKSAANTSELLRQGADVRLADRKGLNAAHHAVVKGDEEQLQLLIENGVSIEHVDQELGTALHYAVSRSSRSHIELLLKAGAPINVPNGHGDTALHLAVQTGRSDAVHLLLQHCADLGATNHAGLTPLTLAIKHLLQIRDIPIGLSLPLLSSLTDAKSDYSGSQEYPLRFLEGLHACARGGNEELMRQFLHHDQIKDLVDVNGMLKGTTPLHVAAQYAWDGAAAVLLNAGADPNVRDDLGETPLITLCASERCLGDPIEFAKAMRKRGADLAATDLQGRTAWSIAREQENYDMMTFLLSNMSSYDTETAPITLEMVNWALSNGHCDFVGACLEHASTCLTFMFEPDHFARMETAFLQSRDMADEKDSRNWSLELRAADKTAPGYFARMKTALKQRRYKEEEKSSGWDSELDFAVYNAQHEVQEQRENSPPEPAHGGDIYTPLDMVPKIRSLLSSDPEEAGKAINGHLFKWSNSRNEKIEGTWSRVVYF